MKTNICKIIEEFCCDQDLSFRSDYSGRGMFGHSCVGFITNNPLSDLVLLTDYIRSELEDYGPEVHEIFGGKIEMDQMGMSSIIYFPKIQYSED